MRLSQWRPLFTKFITDRVQIDSWLLQRPEGYEQVAAFVPPLRDMDYRRVDTTTVVLRATQDLIISQRVSSQLAFNELPLDMLEGYYNTLAIAFMANFEEMSKDVLEVDFNQVETPIAVAEVAEDNNDWIIDLKWSIRVEITVEPEVGGVVDPFYLRQLTANVYRDGLQDDLLDGVSDPTKRILDFTIRWNYPETP